MRNIFALSCLSTEAGLFAWISCFGLINGHASGCHRRFSESDTQLSFVSITHADTLADGTDSINCDCYARYFNFIGHTWISLGVSSTIRRIALKGNNHY
jgi:hypothetical protein